MEEAKSEDRRTRRTRQAIQQAFVELVLESGYESVTVLNIAERADYNRGTFYRHYIGKEELLAELKQKFLEGFTRGLLTPYEGMDQVGANAIYPSSLLIFSHIGERKQLFQALLAADRSFSLELFDALRNSMRKDMHIEMEQTNPPIDYEILLSYQLSATVGVIMHWAETGFKYSAEYMAEQLMLLINGKMNAVVFTRQA